MARVMARKLDEIAADARLLTSSDRAELRGQTSVISELLVYSVEVLMNLAGSSGYMESSPAQRYWRDFSVGMRHGIFNQDINYEVYGAFRLGVDLDVVDPEIL
jgi:alkylation response protein AidB-like acyl-CoA dehydrogenase